MASINRRSFVKSSVAVGAGTLFLPTSLRSNPSPNETFQLAQIGCGRMGTGDMTNALYFGSKKGVNARVVAVCDVDSKRSEKARDIVEAFYSNKPEASSKVQTYGDYRELLSRPDIDGVIISTPDNWHGLIGIAAASAGKHIYMQKPLTYSIPEGQALVKAVRKNKVILQTGAQQRSSVYFRQVCTIIRNQWLGKLKEIQVELPTDGGKCFGKPEPVPSTLNYDMWLGPCPEVPYIEACVHSQSVTNGRPGWLQIERHCLGNVTGWGSHMYDIAQWAMGTDADSGPIEVRSKGDFPDRGHYNVHCKYDGEALYANGVRMTSKSGKAGVNFICENGWAYCTRDSMKCSDPELLRRKPVNSEVTLYNSSDHMGNFITSAQNNAEPISPVEVGHRTNTICVLHHISMKLAGRPIKWDPEKEVPIGDPEVEKMIQVPMRKPYSLS